MILGVSAEQEELRASVRRFLADRAPMSRVRELMDDGETDWAVWEQAGSQLGLQGLAIPESYGGAGFSFAEQAVVLEEFGAALYGGPYLASAVLAATALLASPDEGARRGLLPGYRLRPDRRDARLHRGRRLLGPGRDPAVRGQGRRGLAAGRAQELRARRRHGRPDPGRRRHRRRSFAVRGGGRRGRAEPGRAARAGPDQAAGPAGVRRGDRPADRLPGDGAAALDRALDVAAVALAAEQLGGAQRALDMAVEYAKTRRQFDRPIGSFQAIKHRCADLLLEVESLRSAVGYAAAAVAEDSAEIPVLASLVKAYASETYFHVAAENIQIHGGIGFTWEHDAHLYFKRAKASELFLGDGAYHRERLANRIGL